MKLQAVLFSLGFVQCVVSLDHVESPACMPKCWDNSKYVSACTKLNETLCLCDDAHFQNVVLQCLYSQCPTTQFGSALHHTLSACRGSNAETFDTLPPLIRHQGVRKRGIPTTGIASGHASASVTHSVARRSVSASAAHSARITRSVGILPTVTPRALSSAILFARLSNEDTDSTILLD